MNFHGADPLLATATGNMKRALDAAREEGFRMGLATCERAAYEGEDALFSLLRRTAPSAPRGPRS